MGLVTTIPDLSGWRSTAKPRAPWNISPIKNSFLVRLVAGVPYTFDLRGQATAGGTLLDPLLFCCNSSGATVASGDDLGLGADSSIQFTPTTSGDYSLAAQSSGANDLGSYTISASAPALGLTIAAADADRAEGNSGSTPFAFTITRSDSLTAAINVAWQVTGTGANPADAADFASAVLDTGPSGNIALAAGEASKTLTVNVRGDTLVEPNESFLVSVSSPANGAAVGDGRDPQRRRRCRRSRSPRPAPASTKGRAG